MSVRRRHFYFLATFATIAVAARFFTSMPVAFTFGALAIGWPLVGTAITIDDDLPGGWSNPDGKQVPEWRHLWFWADLLLVRGAITYAMYLTETQLASGFQPFPWLFAVLAGAIGWHILRKQVNVVSHAA